MKLKKILHIGKIVIGATTIVVGAILWPPIVAAGAVLLTLEILNFAGDTAETIIDDLEENSSKIKIVKVTDKGTSTDDLGQGDSYDFSVNNSVNQGLDIDDLDITANTNLDPQGNIDTLGNDNVIIHQSWV